MRRLTTTSAARAAAAVAAITLALAACGSDSDDSDDSEPAADEPAEAAATDAVEISIEGFAFSGATSAAAGETLIVTNNDGSAHTLTATEGEFNTGSLDGGASAEITLPTEAGTYTFFCTIHPTMTGEIIIG